MPRLAKAGHSFLAAGQYYLHDKGADTSDRVAFTHVLNTKTGDPQGALKVMAWTAINQKQVKENFYRSKHPDDPNCEGFDRRGRPIKTSVYHYSLSSHPSETPSEQHMIDAAKSSLKQLRLEDHETLMVGHNDTRHPHIHVIVNKVHPETGRVADLKFTKEKISRWAQAYQKEHGQDWCPERDKNNAIRDAIDDFAKAHNHAPKGVPRPSDLKNSSKADYHMWRQLEAAARAKAQNGAVKSMQVRHAAMLAPLIAERTKEIKQVKAVVSETRFQHGVREEMRPLWAEQLRKEEERRKIFETAMANPEKSLKYFLKNAKDCVQFEGGWLTDAWAKKHRPEAMRAQFEKQLAGDRQPVMDKHRRAAKVAVELVYFRHEDRLAKLAKDLPRQERQLSVAQAAILRARTIDAEQRYRKQRVSAAVADQRLKRDGKFLGDRFDTAAAEPGVTAQNEGNSAGVAQRPTSTVPASRKDRFAANANIPPPAVKSRRPGGSRPEAFKTAARGQTKEERNRPREVDDRVPPWTAYGVAPRRMPHPKGLRKPPVQLKKPAKPSNLSRKTLQQGRDDQRKREDAELAQIFGSVSKGNKARARAANGNVISKTTGAAKRGRARRRSFD